MATSYGITHQVMHCSLVESDADTGCLDRMCSHDLSKPVLWLFWRIYNEPWGLYVLGMYHMCAVQSLG